MRKAAGKRLPHGATSDLVLAALWRLHLQSGQPTPVSRADLIQAVGLPATTVDDRLRVLSSKERRQILNVGRGLYSPIHQKQGPSWGKQWRQRIAQHPTPSSPQKLDKAGHLPQPPGTKSVLLYPEGVVRVEKWLSTNEYTLMESKRQWSSYLAMGWIAAREEQEEDGDL